jgi:hypothetical protein
MDTFLYRTGTFEKYWSNYVSCNVKSILYTIGKVKVLYLFIKKVWGKSYESISYNIIEVSISLEDVA